MNKHQVSLTLSDRILLGNLASHVSSKFMLAEATPTLNVDSQAEELARNQRKASYFGKLADRLAVSAAEQDKETSRLLDSHLNPEVNREAIVELTDTESVTLADLCVNEVTRLEDQISRASLATDVNHLSSLIDDRRALAFKILQVIQPITKVETPEPQVTGEQLTVDDYIAALSKFPKGTPLTVRGVDNVNPFKVIIHPVLDLNDGHTIQHVLLSLWGRHQIKGDVVHDELKHHDWVNQPFIKTTGHELVNAAINELPMYPEGINPFHYDLSSMGTPLVRDWMIMHDGYDNKEDPRALNCMVLVNMRSGQRFRVDLTRIDESGWKRDKVAKQ